jgi:hypothetical protein
MLETRLREVQKSVFNKLKKVSMGGLKTHVFPSVTFSRLNGYDFSKYPN